VYLDYYRLKEPPFNITPDPRFLFFSEKHREAFNHLLFGIQERKGFILLTGEVGAGKTTLCRALLDQLGPKFKTALILNPRLSETQLIKAILAEFGLPLKGRDRQAHLATLNKFLLEQVEEGNDVVLVVDEAQNMSFSTLEQVRLLSNLETDKQKLLQIILMGQPELRDTVNSEKLRQLRQRITVRFHLGPLTVEETAHYVQHRLTIAGANGYPNFDAPAIRAVHQYSRGIPRLINAVCDRALLAGYVHQTDEISKTMVQKAVRDLEGDGPQSKPRFCPLQKFKEWASRA
jgi:general secretion pathway protein A